MVRETQFLDPGIVGPDSLKIGFSDMKPRNCWGNPNTEAGFLNGNPNFNRNF